MADFSPSKHKIQGDLTVEGSTQLGTQVSDVHNFSGSISVSGNVSASGIFYGNGSGLTNLPGGGGGGISWDGSTANGVATYKDGDEATVESKFTYDGASEILSLTGTLNHTGSHYLSGTLTLTGPSAVPLLVMDDQDASAQIGRTHLGYDGTNSDMAVFAHQDNANNTDFSLRQRANGQTELNAKGSTNITFKIASATKMQVDPNGNIGIGPNYAPSCLLDLSGGAAAFHVPNNNALAFVISGSDTTEAGDPENGLYFSVNTAIKKLRTSTDFVIDGTKKLWLGTGSLISSPEAGVGNGYIGWGSGEGRLIISGSANGINLSGTIMAPQVTTGTIAGPGSYVGVDEDGVLVLTTAGGGGGGTPGGSDTQIQFNDGGSFGGQANFTYEKTQSTLFVSASQSIFSGSITMTGTAAIGVAPSYDGQGGDGIVLKVEGGSADTNHGKPVLVCQVTGTQYSGDVGYVGIGTTQPLVPLDIRWNVNLNPNTAGGDVVSFATGTTSPGALYYLNDDGGWVSASAANTGSGNNQLLGIALGNDAQQNGMLIRGWAEVSNFYQDTFKPGQAVYIASASYSGSEGRMSGAAPTAADSYVRIVGYASPNQATIYFNPGTNWVELS